MIVLADVAMISAPSFRSRAYVQRMAQENIMPSLAVLVPGKEPDWKGQEIFDLDIRGDGNCFRFQPSKPAIETFQQHGTPCLELPNSNINDDSVVKIISKLQASRIIYSAGKGGILKPAILACNKKFLHVHGGFVPHYRGSTAFYYSLLEKGCMGASAIWLNEKIDQGPIIARREYSPINGVEIDHILDPAVRAELLVEVLSEKIKTGAFAKSFIDNKDENTFQKIHPVLKHIALQKCGLIT